MTNFARQYRDFTHLRCNTRCLRRWGAPIGLQLQKLARVEVGGTPRSVPQAFAQRSPLHFARPIASAGVPLELWWSNADLVVPDQRQESHALLARIRRFEPGAPVEGFVGRWVHGADFGASARLPLALALLGLLPCSDAQLPRALHLDPAPHDLLARPAPGADRAPGEAITTACTSRTLSWLRARLT